MNNIRKPGESISEWRERVKTQKQDTTEYRDTEITPAILTAPSKETEAFFDDYIERYNKDRFFKVPKWWARRKLNKIRTERLYPDDSIAILNTNVAGISDPHKPLIKLAEGHEDYGYRHEIAHQFNDRLRRNSFKRNRFRSLPKSEREYEMLNNAYFYDMEPFRKKEDYYAVNTQLRGMISADHNNVLRKKLDKTINNLTEDQLMDYLGRIGYINKDHNYRNAYLNESGEGYDPVKIENLKKALIYVRKLGGKL